MRHPWSFRIVIYVWLEPFSHPFLSHPFLSTTKKSTIYHINSPKSTMISFFLTTLIFLRCLAFASEHEVTRMLFPELIVPVTQAFPNRAYVSEHTGNVFFSGDEKNGDEVTALVRFRIPDDKRYDTCQLIFELPEELPPALDVPEYRWSFTGHECILDVFALCGCHKIVAEKTPWNLKPPRYPPKPIYRFNQSKRGGRAGVIGVPFKCPLGHIMEFEIVAAMRDKPMMLHWYELEKPRSGIMLEMFRTGECYQGYFGASEEEDWDSDFEDVDLNIPPKARAKVRGNL
ncbi:hypothetical protein L873DRAFT_69712 [Choiromyces venosus 120613-1]|uniref:Ubiquitin 3 binding protein But2 C-terminal domain-containing protein n=1 Tax=Choiromyces venosus 120613-1 TaxID=1336337 RepID=A0A3N4JA18_9PEZI|nr:hypothetical protein L873DRAFT_69712 [Choiromyces venosus 120613-1]